MAGPFTHMAIVEGAVKSFAADQPLGKILRENRNYLTLGSVSPDIPYLAHLALGGYSWADIMHYHKTNELVENALHSLRAAKTKNKLWRQQLAWLLGYVGHLVADASVHPVVENIVGPYTDKSTNSEHRECEMIQDVLIFKDVFNLELAAAEYTDLLRVCIESSSFEKVAEFWAVHAEINCPVAGKFPTEKIIESYTKELDAAEGGNAFARASRHFGAGFVYSTYQEITQNAPDLVEKYYTKIKLPNGIAGGFREDVYGYAVKNLVFAWSKIDRSLFATENIVNILPCWNLDTGVDQDNNITTYWS